MTNIVPLNTLDPNIPLVRRTEDWIVTLYNQAIVLVEQEYAEEPPELAPWKLLTEEERQVDAVVSLDRERRDWNIQYQNLVDSKALEIASGTIDSVKAAMANIIASRRRKRLRWQTLEYSQVKTVAKETLQLPPGSQGRQIASFIDNHLDIVEKAGVPTEHVLTVLSKEDAFTIAASRAISRAQKMAEAEEITEEERVERVQDIMELAASTDHASNVRKTFINGNKMQIARDVIKVGDDTLVTFICRDEHEFSTLDRKTEGISVEYGNAQPILAESQAARTRIELLEHIKIVWSIYQSGAELTEEERATYAPQDVWNLLGEMYEV